MTKAVVIKMYGDVEIANAIADGMTRHMIPLNVTELGIIRSEFDKLREEPLRRESAAKGPKTPHRARRRKYTPTPHGRAYNAVLGVYGLCVLGVATAAARLSAWNRR